LPLRGGCAQVTGIQTLFEPHRRSLPPPFPGPSQATDNPFDLPASFASEAVVNAGSRKTGMKLALLFSGAGEKPECRLAGLQPA
jgi:hypothetical protein